MWTCLVVTCPDEDWCSPLHNYLDDLDVEVLLVVPDPAERGVGSGGATLNALLVAAEHLSARRGHTTIVSDLLFESRILILHLGPNLLPLPAGLLPVSAVDDDGLPTSNLRRIYDCAGKLMKLEQGPGIMVAGTDILLQGNLNCDESETESQSDIVLYTVPSDVQNATKHGVTVSDTDSQLGTVVQNILYQPSAEKLGELCVNGKVNILSGLVYFSPRVGESLVNLHCAAPLDACTYMGQDRGETNLLQISLYYDILTASCPGVTVDQFVEGKCGKTLSRGRSSVSLAMTAARKLVWTEMRRFRVIEKVLSDCNAKYLPPLKSLDKSDLVNHWLAMVPVMHNDACLIGSRESGLRISCNNNSTSSLPFTLVYGIPPELDKNDSLESKMASLCPDPVCLAYQVDGYASTVVISIRDRFYSHYSSPQSTWLGLPWTKALDSLGLSSDQVWLDVPDKRRSLYTAKLFQVTANKRESLEYISRNHDIENTLEVMRNVTKEVVCGSLIDSRCLPKSCKFSRAITDAVNQGWSKDLLDAFDKVAQQYAQLSGSERTGKLAFILAMTADLLGAMAKGQGGLRSGPANNKEFAKGFKLLDQELFSEGLEALSEARHLWIDRPVRLVRAARHYEGAVQLLVRKTVISAQAQVRVNFNSANPKPQIGEAVVVRCPARLDLSGGWTDTPPICYEMGGKVVDVALSLDGKKPIGCKATRIPEMCAEIVVAEEVIRIRSLADLENHCNPSAKGALLKCCLLAAKILDLTSLISVEDQLKTIFGSGLRLESWSELPQGSGMGTSSILAAAVIAAAWTAAGSQFDNRDVVHAVLVVEQLLTTGGGWQDQVGGLYPGINVGTSPDNTQVSVDIEHINVSEEFLAKLESRLLVLYTGKPRLAKNLLQNVVRNWYSKDELIHQTFKNNYSLAGRCRERVKGHDIEGLAECLSEYYEIKKTLAPGSEPDLVKRILKALSPVAAGGSLAGAGGGGFLAVILKAGVEREAAMDLVRNEVADTDQVRFYAPTIDNTGMVVERPKVLD